MIIHPIHDLNNSRIIEILTNGLSKISDANVIVNYHPDYADNVGNLFFILKDGRYKQNSGTYFVIEEDGRYIASAGWNEYPKEYKTALVLSRMYVAKEFRGLYLVGKHILPITIGESLVHNNKLWLTFNKHNERINHWFKAAKKSRKIPQLYKLFDFIGQQQIYNTDQYVYQYHPRIKADNWGPNS